MKSLLFMSLFIFANAHAVTMSAPNAKVFFTNLEDGATVTSPFLVKFGIKGMEIAPAGTNKQRTGHHHLFIDAEDPTPNLPIPTDANHMHFGKGQTEANITLTPGKHTLQLVLGDLNHVPFTPPVVSKKITVTVK